MFKAVKAFTIKHIEPRFYGALWFLGGAVAAWATVLAIMALTGRHGHKDEIVFLGAMLAIIVSTIGWMWTGRMSVLMARKTNALALLERLSSSNVAELKVKVYNYVAEYAAFQDTNCDKPRPVMPETEIEQLLSVYEQVSVAVVKGAADHEMIHESQNLVFQRIYLGLRHHIEKVQQKNKLYYNYFESLTCTWHPDLVKRTVAVKVPGGLFSPMQDADS